MEMPSGQEQPDDPMRSDVEAAQGGDRAAAARLIAAVLPRVRNLVRYLIRGDEDVEDVAQEALVLLLRGLGGYRAEGSFRSWADRVVARSTFAWLERRKAHEQRALETVQLSTGAPEAGAVDEYLLRRRMAQALDTLPFEQRHALVLHHVLEMSVPEVAEETRAPVETVRSRLRLGRLRLRELLAPATERKVS
jgi:RNA polymerase sigma-70 factor (ECF subfamily)